LDQLHITISSSFVVKIVIIANLKLLIASFVAGIEVKMPCESNELRRDEVFAFTRRVSKSCNLLGGHGGT